MEKSTILKKPRKKMTYEEFDTQSSFFKWLELQHPKHFNFCFAIPNEGKRSFVTTMFFKRRGLRPGVSDVFCAIPSGQKHGLFIEFKRKNNGPTEKQSLFQDLMTSVGYECAVCDSFENAISVFSRYLYGTPL